jgi:hypothetical protein
MAYRIYVDESGTHSDDWLVIGMLFVPDHGPLHSDLCRAKEGLSYLNNSPKHHARYKETHLTKFRSSRDVDVAKKWIDLFAVHGCYYRCVVVDWKIWDRGYFGDPFEPEALAKRRAYKKWAEMLLHPEVKDPAGCGRPMVDGRLFLDRLRVAYGYDALGALRDRFTENYHGAAPYIKEFQATDSWRDANQCLQLCDLLTGCLYQELCPAASPEKRETKEYLESVLKTFGVQRLSPGFWKQYDQSTLTRHLSKFSAWFWRPLTTKERKAKLEKGRSSRH